MSVYLRPKFEVSSIILTGVRQGGGVILLPPTSKGTPKKPIEIRVKGTYSIIFLLSVGLLGSVLSIRVTVTPSKKSV